MTDRYNSLTVALNRDIRDDDADVIINAIRMIKGVVDVTGNVVDHDSYTAEIRTREKVVSQLQEIINNLYNK